MSQAGWKRQDLCTAESSDAGSHFVCVDMPSDFWVNTGQASSQEEADSQWPKPGPWCICMWYARTHLSPPSTSSLLTALPLGSGRTPSTFSGTPNFPAASSAMRRTSGSCASTTGRGRTSAGRSNRSASGVTRPSAHEQNTRSHACQASENKTRSHARQASELSVLRTSSTFPLMPALSHFECGLECGLAAL